MAIGEELIGGIDFTLQVVRDHDDGQDGAGDDVSDDELNEGEVAALAIRHGGHADDGEGAGFGRDDGKSNAPPGDVFAAEKIITGVALAASKPQAHSDDAGKVKQDDGPIAAVEKLGSGVAHYLTEAGVS